jgi:alkylation response protein AidB-like acyl-CoA dehydrogenase
MTTLTQSPGADYYLLDELLTDEARAVRDRVRAFVDTEVLPIINDYWDRAEFPFELVGKIAQLGIVGTTIDGYGCPGAIAAGHLAGDKLAARTRSATPHECSPPPAAAPPGSRWGTPSPPMRSP